MSQLVLVKTPILLVPFIFIQLCWTLSFLAESFSGWSLTPNPPFLFTFLVRTQNCVYVLIQPHVGIGLSCVLLEVYLDKNKPRLFFCYQPKPCHTSFENTQRKLTELCRTYLENCVKFCAHALTTITIKFIFQRCSSKFRMLFLPYLLTRKILVPILDRQHIVE